MEPAALREPAALDEVLWVPDEVEVPLALEPVLPVLFEVLLEVPAEVAVPGRLTVAFAASAWKFAKLLVELAAVFSLMTIVIPLWQCFP